MLKILVLNDTRSEHHHGCSRVMNVIDLYIKRYEHKADYVSLEQQWDKSEQIKKKIIQSDLVIINGEGTIHDNSILGTALVKVAKFAHYHDVQTFLINSTFQNNSQISHEDMKYFSLIAVRESKSMLELKKINIEARVVPDLTFYFENEQFSNNRNCKLYTDSVDQYKTSILHNFGKNKTYFYSNIFNNNLNKVSLGDRLLSIYKNNPSILRILLKFLCRIFARNKKTVINEKSVFNHIEYAEQISKAEYILCGRFHSICYAINSLTPFQAITSNTYKIEGLLDDIGLSLNKFMVDIECIEEQVDDNLKFDEEEVKKIHLFKKQTREKIDQLFKDVLDDKK